MALKKGPLVFGLTLLALSFHPVFVEVLGWAIPIQEQGERPLFASLGLVLAGLAFVAHGCFDLRLRRRKAGAEPDADTDAS